MARKTKAAAVPHREPTPAEALEMRRRMAEADARAIRRWFDDQLARIDTLKREVEHYKAGWEASPEYIGGVHQGEYAAWCYEHVVQASPVSILGVKRALELEAEERAIKAAELALQEGEPS